MTSVAAGVPKSTLPRRRILSALKSQGAFAPAVLLRGGFFLVPLGIIICYSFWEVVDYNVVHNWTLGNYRYFFSVGAYVKTMWATLWVSLAATAIALGLAFPFAYWLSRYVPRRLRAALLILVVVPFWTSYLLRVYSWLTILGQNGLLNRSSSGRASRTTRSPCSSTTALPSSSCSSTSTSRLPR